MSTDKDTKIDLQRRFLIGSSLALAGTAASGGLTGCGSSALSPKTAGGGLPPPLAATPEFAPVAGTYSSALSVTISSDTTGATIYYTTNGTTPTTGSTLYTGAITVSATETVQAIATASGYAQSNVGSAAYTISGPLTITTISPLPNANNGTAYTATSPLVTMSASGGTGTGYTWSITSQSGSNTWSITSGGAIYGTPTTNDTDDLYIRVTDSASNVAGPSLFTVTVSKSSVVNQVGFGLNGVTSYSSELPFANMINAGSLANVAGAVGWRTVNSSGSSTGEEAILAPYLDPSGWPTKVTGSSIGATFTAVRGYLSGNTLNTKINASATVPQGQYTIQFIGTGTIQMYSDGTLIGTASNTTNNAAGVVTTGTFTAPNGSINWYYNITASDVFGTGNHVRNIAIVQTSSLSAYNTAVAGGSPVGWFNPLFLAAHQNTYCVRCMDWLATNDSVTGATAIPTGAFGANVTLTAAPAQGATSAVFNGTWVLPIANTAGPILYNVTFSNGQMAACQVSAAGTNPTLTWTTPLTSACTTAIFISAKPSTAAWTQRPTQASAFWTTGANNEGVPWEVPILLANALYASYGNLGVVWVNIPPDASDAYITSLANLFFNGAGSSIPGFTGLNPNIHVYLEFGNEVWNGSFNAHQYAIAMNEAVFNGSSSWQNWYGMRCAQIADIFYSVYGSQFASRVFASIGGQSGNFDGVLNVALSTPLWTGSGNAPAVAHHITHCHTAPYLYNWGASNADMLYLSETLGGTAGLDDFFSIQYTTNVGASGHVYGTPSNGCIPGEVSVIAGDAASLAANFGSYNLTLCGYEGGPFIEWGTPTGTNGAFWIAAMEDPRMASVINTYLTKQKAVTGWGWQNMFVDCEDPTTGSSSCYGQMQSIMQPISGANTPPRYLGTQQFALGQA